MKMTSYAEKEVRSPEGIRLYAEADFEGMRVAGRLAAEILDMIGDHVVPGVTTGALDDLILAAINEAGATSATIGYRGYTKASCISINHVVCHGIPGEKKIKNGDILNIDVTVIVDGWFGDSSRMYVAGKANRKAERLIDITHESLMRGIAAVKPGNRFGDIGAAIQAYAESHRCGVVGRLLWARIGAGFPRRTKCFAFWTRQYRGAAPSRNVFPQSSQ